MSIKYGYGRVSTMGQDLKVQKSHLMDQGVEEDNIYAEKITGASDNRPQLNNLLKVATDGDTVYITKIDRLARSIVNLKNLVEEFRDLGVTIIFIQDNLTFKPDSNSPADNLMLSMLGSFAEFERDLITNRMKEGKEFAKLDPNFKEGRPKRKLTPKYIHALEVLKDNSYKVTERKTGVSVSTLQRIKKQYINETGDNELKLISDYKI